VQTCATSNRIRKSIIAPRAGIAGLARGRRRLPAGVAQACFFFGVSTLELAV